MNQYFVRLPLDGVNNCRDLGGYAAGTTNKTQWGRFLRSSRLTDLTEESATVLKNYGEELKLIIDLRSKEEMKDYPVSEFLEDVVCINIDLLDIGEGYISSAYRFAGAESDPTFMSRLYIEMLEHTQGMRKIFLEMLQIEKGTVLFNCSQGKDCTGVVAFLLLGLAGVNKEDIVANYEISFTHIQESYNQLVDGSPLWEVYPLSVLKSNPENMRITYEYLLKEYSSFKEYFIQRLGFTKVEVDELKQRLIGS